MIALKIQRIYLLSRINCILCLLCSVVKCFSGKGLALYIAWVYQFGELSQCICLVFLFAWNNVHGVEHYVNRNKLIGCYWIEGLKSQKAIIALHMLWTLCMKNISTTSLRFDNLLLRIRISIFWYCCYRIRMGGNYIRFFSFWLYGFIYIYASTYVYLSKCLRWTNRSVVHFVLLSNWIVRHIFTFCDVKKRL